VVLLLGIRFGSLVSDWAVNTELGAYHTNMCMISGNICVEYASKIRFTYKMTKRSDHHHHGLTMALKTPLIIWNLVGNFSGPCSSYRVPDILLENKRTKQTLNQEKQNVCNKNLLVNLFQWLMQIMRLHIVCTLWKSRCLSLRHNRVFKVRPISIHTVLSFQSTRCIKSW